MITPYLVFYGNCADALAFYAAVFNTRAGNVMSYGDYVPAGLAPVPKGLANWVMHAEMELCGAAVWFADETEPVRAGNNLRLTLTLPTAKEAKAVFDALCQDGQVRLPPTDTFYSSFHAEVTDKFGVGWGIVAEEAPT